MSKHNHKADPGRARAVELLLVHFDTERHRRGSAYASHDGGRECLGCGSAGAGLPGNFGCYGGGPTIDAWCSACYAKTGEGILWRHRLSWAQFYRLIETRAVGQDTLFGAAS